MEFLKELFYEPLSGDLYDRKGNLIGYNDCRGDGYLAVKINTKTYRVHNLIWEMHYGPVPKGKMIDHADGDSSNNRLENLRLASYSQNNQNRRTPLVNSSGYKGVSLMKLKNKDKSGYIELKNPWLVHIKKNGVLYTKYGFPTALEAAHHYDEKALELHGEFAKLNFTRM